MEMFAVRVGIGEVVLQSDQHLGEKEHSSGDAKGGPQLLNIYTMVTATFM